MIQVKPAPRRIMPRNVWVLGFGSMFMDISSEMIHSLLPVFMATVLGASMIAIGVIEGIAEATAAIAKVFSGMLSDYVGKRKPLIVLGYGLAAITKPVFPLATTIVWVFGARFVDRLGKGIRGAPRDALVADSVPPHLRGAAFGLRQALDSVGAFIGPLLALALMIGFVEDIRFVLWIAVFPAFLAVLLLAVAIREPEYSGHGGAARNRLRLADAKRLSSRYWLIVALGAVFTLARFSEAFLILRAQGLGLAISFAPAVLIVMNIIYALVAYPAGAAADRLSARALLTVGLLVLVGADLILALARAPWIALLGAACWGLHMALTQGLLAKLVADAAPADLRGTAFGVFNLANGGAMLLASVIAGMLWSLYGAAATFVAGAVFAAVAAIGSLFYHPRQLVSHSQ